MIRHRLPRPVRLKNQRPQRLTKRLAKAPVVDQFLQIKKALANGDQSRAGSDINRLAFEMMRQHPAADALLQPGRLG